jgi:hypothetical protein
MMPTSESQTHKKPIDTTPAHQIWSELLDGVTALKGTYRVLGIETTTAGEKG